MFQNTPNQITVDFFGQKLTLQSGLLAQQATAAVLATIGGTSVLCAVVVGKESLGDYFPLQVVYEERYYAAGKIKSSQWSKREARPSDNAILTGRMIDRSLRSLFDPDIRTEIQVIITVLSLDKHNPPDTLAVLAASTAMQMCQFQPKVSHIETSQIKKLLGATESTSSSNIIVQFNTAIQIYSLAQQVDITPNDQLISLGEDIIDGQIAYKAYLTLTNQPESQFKPVDQIPKYILENHNQAINQVLIRAVSKAIQLGHDVTNSPSVYNTQFTPVGYLDYKLYRGPVASVRIGYTSADTNSTSKSSPLNSILPIYEGVNTLAELQALDTSTHNLFKNLDLADISNLEYLAKISKTLTQKSPQLGIYFKNIADLAKENYVPRPSLDSQAGNYEVNPSYEYLRTADLDIVISGNGDNIVMVECGANIVDESVISQALELSVEPIKQLISLQNQFVNQLD